MKKANARDLDLQIVRADLQTWRAQRKGKERIPEQLWSAAISLLKRHAFYKVSRVLKLNTKQLQKRCNLVGQATKANGKPTRTFLEFSAEELAGSVAPLKNIEAKVAV